MTWIPKAMALLKASIARSGLSNSAYARIVLVRDPRQLRRWLAGTSLIPIAVVQFLESEAQALGPDAITHLVEDDI